MPKLFSTGFIDRSETGKLALTGREAKAFLQGQVTNDVEALTEGHGLYAAFLTPKGKMLGDLRVLDTGAELLLLTERAALQELWALIHRTKVGFDVEVHKRTLQCGLLSVLGPEARTAAGVPHLPAEEHANARAEFGGADVRAIATDLGVDLLFDAADAPGVEAALAEHGVAHLASVEAEALRVESGRPRFGVDLDPSVIPQEAGLNERAVSFSKGCYVGQETVARLHYRGKPNRQLRGLRLSAPAAPGAELRLGERAVGTVASSVVSERLGPIALALVRREAAPGDRVEVGGPDVTAEVVELPF
jgi:folate-binding protein YgfZ